jgi:DNA processing protein
MSRSRSLDPRSALMVLSSMIEPGDADLDDLVTEAGPLEAVDRIWAGDVPDRLRRLTAPSVAAIRNPADRAAQIEAATAACGARVLIPDDPEWPQQLHDLREIGDDDEPHLRPPRCLWIRGRLDLATLTERAVGIVGSRAASEYGRHLADDLASDLAEAGWTVVSGAALGIDRAAHLGSLARGGPTVAVMPSGLGDPYPKANRNMLDLIADNGALVSEWPPDTTVMRYRFLIRNRLLAALTAGVIVVEAGQRSGARNTARYTAELGRLLMFTPGPVTSSMSAGVHQLAREPLGARLVTSAREVIEDLCMPAVKVAAPEAHRPRTFDELTEVEQRLMEALPQGYLVETERLAAAAGVPTETVRQQLDRLRQDDFVDHVDGRWRAAQIGAV